MRRPVPGRTDTMASRGFQSVHNFAQVDGQEERTAPLRSLERLAGTGAWAKSLSDRDLAPGFSKLLLGLSERSRSGTNRLSIEVNGWPD